MKAGLLRNKYSKYYLLAWVILYAAFLVLGIFLPNSIPVAILRLTSILLCLVYVILNYRKDFWLVLALAFTLSADIFLAINHISIAGVLVFCFAQFCHFMRLKKPPLSFCVGFYVCLIVLFALSLIFRLDPIYLLAAVYGVLIIYNLILSKNWLKKSRSISSKNAFYGFSLFLCCDILVAFSFLSGIGVLATFIQPIANYFSWFFYLPSQILIANSGIAKRNEPVLE